jgi:hypothetical protein
MKVPRRLLKILGRLCAALGAISLVASIVTYIHACRFVDSAARAEGTVIKMVERRSRDSGTMYSPVFVFRDAQGRNHEIYSSVSRYPPAYKVGETVTVLYDGDDPDHAKLDGFFDLWLVPLVLGIIGGANMIIALAFLAVPSLFGMSTQEPKKGPAPA